MFSGTRDYPDLCPAALSITNRMVSNGYVLDQDQALRATGLPVRTITFDNGAEMAKYRKIEDSLGATVFFADPFSLATRSNEDFNANFASSSLVV